MKKIDETRNYFIEQIKQNEFISKKHKKICKILSCTEDLLILASKVTGCVSNYAFASLAGIPVDIASSAITMKICVINAGIMKKKKDEKLVLLAQTKLNTVEVFISKALFDSNISHDEFF